MAVYRGSAAEEVLHLREWPRALSALKGSQEVAHLRLAHHLMSLLLQRLLLPAIRAARMSGEAWFVLPTYHT